MSKKPEPVEETEGMVEVAAFRWRGSGQLVARQGGPENRPDLRRSRWPLAAVVRDRRLNGWEVEVGVLVDGTLAELTIRPAAGWVPNLPVDPIDFFPDSAPQNVGDIHEPGHVPDGGITRRLLRGEVAVGAIVRAVRAAVRAEQSAVSPGFQLPPSIRASWAEVFRNDPRPGRRGRDDAFYAVLAANYVQHLGSLSPIADLAREMHLNAKTVRSLVSEARRRELLTRTPRGVAGGELTAKALALLESED